MLLQEIKATEIMSFLRNLPQCKNCTLYGSLAEGRADRLSDIDISVDVSGIDNGVFIKELPTIMESKFNVLWKDYAPSLAPDKYVVSIAIDENNPFCVVDLNCTANPHMTSVQKSDLENDIYIHLLKLWITNCKHYLRGADCTRDVQKMGKKCIGTQVEHMSDEEIIEEVLCRLEEKSSDSLITYVLNCRKVWDDR